MSAFGLQRWLSAYALEREIGQGCGTVVVYFASTQSRAKPRRDTSPYLLFIEHFMYIYQIEQPKSIDLQLFGPLNYAILPGIYPPL